MLDGVRIPQGRGNFEGEEGGKHCKVQGHSVLSCAKTTEMIEMQFGLWAQMGPRNHVRWESTGGEGRWPIRSLELSLPGLFAPWPSRSLELTLPGAKWPWNFLVTIS